MSTVQCERGDNWQCWDDNGGTQVQSAAAGRGEETDTWEGQLQLLITAAPSTVRRCHSRPAAHRQMQRAACFTRPVKIFLSAVKIFWLRFIVLIGWCKAGLVVRPRPSLVLQCTGQMTQQLIARPLPPALLHRLPSPSRKLGHCSH